MVDVKLLEKLNTKEKLVSRAKRHFGQTVNCLEAGYILEDGSMLDFSGKKFGGSPNRRDMDHREICPAIDHSGKGISGDECMSFFQEHANAIRFGAYGSSRRGYELDVQVDTYNEPTVKQVQRLTRCCRVLSNADIMYDIYDDRKNRVAEGVIDKGSCHKKVTDLVQVLNKVK